MASRQPNEVCDGQTGAPGYGISIWWGLSATAASPETAVSRLNREIAEILAEPESIKRLNSIGAEPASMPANAFGKFIISEIEKWKRVAREAKIKAG